jgi:hypothetical protein
VPLEHVAVANGTEGHDRKHAPQLSGSLPVGVSHPFALLPSQFANPALHAPMPHAPPLQLGVAFATVQVVPQAPQFAVLERVSTSQPSAATPLQSRKPIAHASVHAPARQRLVAFGRDGQTAPHALQFAASFVRSVSQPFIGLRSQSSWPAVQRIEHVPEVHVGAAKGPLGQRFRHAPQLYGSFERSTSHPSAALPLQSRKPGSQLAIVHAPILHPPVA